MTEQPKPTGLALLREPFPANLISKLPKPTKGQTEAVRADFKKGIRCKICGAWHHPEVVHLDYVGHAALTDRLLDADPNWNWEPVTDNGLPKLDQNVGMWIKLTVCDVTRLGYGHAEGKTGGDAIKEVIGDALRNAAMRFGAALDLWHKGDLHADDEPAAPPPAQQAKPAPPPKPAPVQSNGNAAKAKTLADEMIGAAKKHSVAAVTNHQNFPRDIEWLEVNSPDEFDRVQAVLNPPKDTAAMLGDHIPYEGK